MRDVILSTSSDIKISINPALPEPQSPGEVVPLRPQPPLGQQEVRGRDVVVLVQVQRLDYVLL